MMRFVHVAVFVLGVLSVGHSAPVTNCETLTQQRDLPEIDQLLGKWIYLAEVTTLPGSKLLTKLLVKNVWADITRAEETNTINITQSQKMTGRCLSITTKYRMENNTLFTSHPYEASEIMLETTCPDCMVFLTNFSVRGNSYRSLQLSSRRSTLTTDELEEFKKQAQCLNLPAPVFLNEDTDFCPDVPATQETETETIDLTSLATSEVVSEAFKLLEKMSTSEAKLKKFAKLLSSGVPLQSIPT